MSFLNVIQHRLQNQPMLKAIPLKIRKCFYLNLSKDVTVYMRDNAHAVRLLSFCAFSQWGVITYNSIFFYQHLPAYFSWIPKDPSDVLEGSGRVVRAKWSYRLAASLFLFSTSTMVILAACVHSFRCVHSVTLLKSSDKVLLKTYTPLGTIHNTLASIPNVSAIRPRSASSRYVPLKVKDQYFNFLVDLSGRFTHPTLFDRTVG